MSESSPSKDGAAAADHLELWFKNHHLPWNEAVTEVLEDLGVDSVKDLKLLTNKHVDELFPGAKFIVKQRAELAWKDLGGKREYVFEKKPPPVVLVSPSPPKKAKHDNGQCMSMKKNNLGPSLEHFKFTQTVLKSKQEKEKEKEEKEKLQKTRATATIITLDSDSSDDRSKAEIVDNNVNIR